MPHYSYRHTFAAGGSKNEPEELEMPCSWGILTDVTLSFPPGCHGVVHVHVDESLHQIFPANQEDDYAFDGFPLQIGDEYELLQGTRTIYLRGYNLGTYPHTIDVAFNVKLPGRYSAAEEALIGLVQVLKRLTGI